MPDIENVIKEIKAKIAYAETTDQKIYSDAVRVRLLKDVLELLKEKEPVKPVNVRWEIGINGGNCPKCMNRIQRTYNYCPFCGKEMKWE